jgi:ABC-type lipoprotein release transport system permease subunit
MAWRNVWRHSRRTIIVLIATTLGLALLLFFDGLFGGSEQAIFGNAVKLQGGNVLIHATGYRERARRMPLLPVPDDEAVLQAAQAQTHVIAASRRIKTGGMVSSRESTLPVSIIGIEPQREAATGLLAENVARGRYLAAGDEDLLLIGQALADRLEVGVGDRVTLVGRATHEQIRRRTVTVVGIYDLGLPEVEKNTVYVSLAEAQILFDLRGQATEVVVSLEGVGQEESVLGSLRSALPANQEGSEAAPGYEVDSWYTLNPEMMQALAVNEQVMAMFGLVVLLVAAVGILNLLLMAVFERTREIGILAALGLKRRQILALFLQEGVLIGLIGALVGSLLGGAVVWYLSRVGLPWSAGEYSELTALMGDRIYFRMGIDQLLGRALTVAVIAALASLYPAWQASRKEPAEALHYV